MSFAGNFKRRLRDAVGGSVALTIGAFVLDDLLARLGLSDPNPAPDEHLGGRNLEQDLSYSRRIATAYRSHGVDRGVVAEIGPGGSAAVALHLLASGVGHVDLVDRFVFSHDDAFLQGLYAAIIEGDAGLKDRLKDRNFDKLISFERGEEAAAERFFPARSAHYDAVCSCAVLEHVTDPLVVLEAATAALKPGGRHVHYVDFRDHGMFSAAGHHALTFLTIPEAVYRHMGRRRGRPNRILLPQYRDWLDRLPLDWDIRVTSLLGVGPVEHSHYPDLPAAEREVAEALVEEIRPRLAQPYRSMRVEDLAVDGIALVAVKP